MRTTPLLFPVTSRLFVVFACLGAGLALLLPTPGCSALSAKGAESAVGSACSVIDMAKEACMILRYADKDGHLVEVSVPAEDAKEFAKSMGAKHGAKPVASASK